MENADYPLLEARLGRDRLSERLLRQASKTARLLHQGEGLFRLERFLPIDTLVRFGLKISGMGRITHRHFLDVRRCEIEWDLPSLPRSFDGFRLLQLSDLHADLDARLTPRIVEQIRATPHDAAVITGDYRNATDGDYDPCLAQMQTILPELSPARWGILGNHDFIEMVPTLEALGLPILLNEVAVLERGDARLWLAGIDDPHFYQTHDLEKVRAQTPPDACVILLAHSPEIYAESAATGFSLQLSGHTHGGQLCLPGGRHLVVPCRIPPKFIRGRWSHGALQGYTSPGTGSCGVPARLNCPPEITLHRLRVPASRPRSPTVSEND